MSRRRNKSHGKTFQQRQSERLKRDASDRAVVENMAGAFTCSTGVARDFAGQCEERLVDLDFDLLCSDLALRFWASSPSADHPVVELLHELANERRRHRAAVADIRARLVEHAGKDEHHHLSLPVEHYRQQIGEQLFPDLYPRPVQNSADSGDR